MTSLGRKGGVGFPKPKVGPDPPLHGVHRKSSEKLYRRVSRSESVLESPNEQESEKAKFNAKPIM